MCRISCIIIFQNAIECYRPGEDIKGSVVLEISGTSNIMVKALSLQFTGFAHTQWEMIEKVNKSVKAKPKTFIEYREDYVSTTNYLMGSEMANLKSIEPGIYNYSFIINIPQNIPPTFDSPLGFIRYALTVHADYGDHTNPLYDFPILIEKLKDLRLMDPAVQLPAETEQLEQKSYMKFWQKPLQLYITLPQKAFSAGESISVDIKLTNLSKLKINILAINLNRITTYKGLIKEKRSHKTSEITTIVSNIYNLYGNNSNVIQVLQEIFIPKTPPTMTFDECKCISLSYELEVLFTCENKKRWVKAIIPILIGSISLRSDIKFVPFLLNNNNVAAISVARSMEELTLPSAIDLQASSSKEPDFMTAVHFNKKSRFRIVGDLNDFKPKYLYYDMPEELHYNLPDKQSKIFSAKIRLADELLLMYKQ